MQGDRDRKKPSRDWRDPAQYRDLERLDRSGFAWEYLRRNPKFRREGHASATSEVTHRSGASIVSPEHDRSLTV